MKQSTSLSDNLALPVSCISTADSVGVSTDLPRMARAETDVCSQYFIIHQ